ncbi:MAG TPA: hypothetical protein VEW04_04795 [Allosphingosinicella sp.]|nr:hypothetical protein [Allosphingosinicella sp.]
MVTGGRKTKLATLAALGLATASCTALPDTSGYTAASLQLRTSAAAAGSALSTELGRMTELLPAARRPDAVSIAGQFDEAWATTVASLGALGRYAESIEAVTKAGNNGAAAANGVADSVNGLAGALGIVPGAALVGVATDTFAFIYSQIANIRATRSLERSLDLADPLIRDMSNVVGGQVTAAKALFQQAIQLEGQALDFGVDDIAALDADLETRENDAARTLAALAAQGGRDDARRAADAELKRIRDGRAAIAPRMAAYRTARTALAARARAGNELFAATDNALATWREGHTKMVRAIRERRPVSFESLTAAAQEIRELSRRWRDL